MSGIKSQTEMSKHIGYCPICFDDLSDKCVASPDICEHLFCYDCLLKSSKLGSFCPVDRKRYRKIINFKSGKSIQIKPRRRKKQRELYDITVYCEICSKSSEGEKLLLCDCCDLGYHCKCLSPPLESVPSGQWFCPPCLAVEEKMKKSRGITKETECSGTEANYCNIQGKEGRIKKRMQDNTSEHKYGSRGKESTVTKGILDNTTENRYFLEEKKNTTKNETEVGSVQKRYVFREKKNTTKNETEVGSVQKRYVFRERSKRRISETESIGKDNFSEEGSEKEKEETVKEKCNDTPVLGSNHIKPEGEKMEFKKNNFGEAKVIVEKVNLHNFFPTSTSTQKEINLKKVVAKPNMPFEKTKDFENSDSCHLDNKLKSLELQKFSVFEKMDDMNISKQKYSTIKSLSSEISHKSLSNGILNLGSVPNHACQEKHAIFGKSSQFANERNKFLMPCVHLKDFKLSSISNVHSTCQNLQCVQCNSFISSLSTSLKGIKKHKKIESTNQNSLCYKNTSHSIVQNNSALPKVKIFSKELKKIKKEKKVKHWQSAKLKYRCDAYKTLIEYLSSTKTNSSGEAHHSFSLNRLYNKDFSGLEHTDFSKCSGSKIISNREFHQQKQLSKPNLFGNFCILCPNDKKCDRSSKVHKSNKISSKITNLKYVVRQSDCEKFSACLENPYESKIKSLYMPVKV